MMKKLLAMGAIAMVITIFSCQNEDSAPTSKNNVSQDVLNKINQMGFSSDNVQAVGDSYLVEGDILLSAKDLGSAGETKFLRIAETEQYRTNNLVSAPRTIRVSISSSFSSIYVAALDEALGRYNALGISLTFQRVSSGADISIVKSSSTSYLASSGFPSGGRPYSQVLVSTTSIGSQPQSTIASILAHELGHCIGFRHTDYADRSYSCGGSHVNEGASTVGAVHIPGTPSGPDAGSWMLACIGSGQNRPFNSNDKVALNYLY